MPSVARGSDCAAASASSWRPSRDIERLEFGAGIDISIADANGTRWMGGERIRNRPALLLAEHEPRAALAALASIDPPPHAEMLRVLALAELGDLTGLVEATPALLAHAADPRWLGDLVLALRRHPMAAAALRDAAGSTLLPALRSIWAFAHTHRNDPRLRGEILDGLISSPSIAPRTRTTRPLPSTTSTAAPGAGGLTCTATKFGAAFGGARSSSRPRWWEWQ